MAIIEQKMRTKCSRLCAYFQALTAIKKKKTTNDFHRLSPFVGMRRLERPTPTSRTQCATNCATFRTPINFERNMGFEPTTLGLGSQCSTTELISQFSCHRHAQKRVCALLCKFNCNANIRHIRGFSRKKQEFFKISSLFCLFICGNKKKALHLHSQKPRCHSSVGRAKD